MISVAHFLEYVKDEIRYITGAETVFCPDCGCLMKLYNEYGMDGLEPKGRVPEHNVIVSKEILAEAIRLRREVPSRSVSTIIQILELEVCCSNPQFAFYGRDYILQEYRSPHI